MKCACGVTMTDINNYYYCYRSTDILLVFSHETHGTISMKWQSDLVKSLHSKHCFHLSSCRQLCTILNYS